MELNRQNEHIINSHSNFTKINPTFYTAKDKAIPKSISFEHSNLVFSGVQKELKASNMNRFKKINIHSKRNFRNKCEIRCQTKFNPLYIHNDEMKLKLKKNENNSWIMKHHSQLRNVKSFKEHEINPELNNIKVENLLNHFNEENMVKSIKGNSLALALLTYGFFDQVNIIAQVLLTRLFVIHLIKVKKFLP